MVVRPFLLSQGYHDPEWGSFLSPKFLLDMSRITFVSLKIESLR
jgi:hypothetical protein